MWRRVRSHLEREGFVKVVLVTDSSKEDDKPKTALKLVKPFAVQKCGASLDTNEEEEEAEQVSGSEAHAAERSFEWHALALLVQAGK